MAIIHHLGMFLLGIRDSTSLLWIKNIMLYTDPRTLKIHPSSKKMIDCFKMAFIQVLFFMIGIPKLFQFFGFDLIYILLNLIFLLLTYGYIFFYNEDIISATREIILWKEKRNPGSYFKLDIKQNIQMFTSFSGQIRGFIFLVFYYVPILIVEMLFLSKIPYVGKATMLLSQSFFQGTFYFLTIWHYDKYNVGFIEKNMFYMMGYGFFVTMVCNLAFQGSVAQGVYFIFSLWMLINCVVFSPPQIEFKSFADIKQVLFSNQKRNRLVNAYNKHRQSTRKSKQYRKEIKSEIKLLNPALKIAQLINDWVAEKLNKKYGSEPVLDQETYYDQKGHSITQISSQSKKQQKQKEAMEIDKDSQKNKNS